MCMYVGMYLCMYASIYACLYFYMRTQAFTHVAVQVGFKNNVNINI